MSDDFIAVEVNDDEYRRPRKAFRSRRNESARASRPEKPIDPVAEAQRTLSEAKAALAHANALTLISPSNSNQSLVSEAIYTYRSAMRDYYDAVLSARQILDY